MPTDGHAERPIPHRWGRAEYRRLLAAGVNEDAALVLAQLYMRQDDERAYWRQLAAGKPSTAATRAAHAQAQRQRRSAA